MSQDTPRDQMSKRRVVYSLPGMESVTVRRGEAYRIGADGPLTMDVYFPPTLRPDRPAGAVLLVTGYSDLGAQRLLGAKFKDIGPFVSWAQLIAMSGMVAITYENREPADVHAVLHHIERNAASLGIDAERIGVWACSGHGPNGLSVLMQDGNHAAAAAALVYPYTLDLEGATHVVDAARQFRFVTPAMGRSVTDLRRGVPLFIARAGGDEMPGLNVALDRFIAAALAADQPLTLVNHAAGAHGFDLADDSAASRGVIRQLLDFLTSRLAT
jgi:hypothetical protein